MPQPLITIKNLRKTRSQGRGYELLIPSLQIRQGEFWALLGQSGSGKSTALDILALILRPDSCEEFSLQTTPNPNLGLALNLNTGSGDSEKNQTNQPEEQTNGQIAALDADSFSLNNSRSPALTFNQAAPQMAANFTSFNVAQAWAEGNLDSLANIRAKYFGYVLQIGGLLPFLNVRDNILLSRKIAGLSGVGPVPELADQLGITHLLGKKIDQISVGERQRVAIARALAHEPVLVLADEPTSALDPLTAADVLDLLISLTRQQRAALLVASHDWAAVRRAGFRELYVEMDMDSTASTRKENTPSAPELLLQQKNGLNKISLTKKMSSGSQAPNPIRAVLREAKSSQEFTLLSQSGSMLSELSGLPDQVNLADLADSAERAGRKGRKGGVNKT